MHLEQRVLVTGGSGFLGSHLCERLLAAGANVICLDNFFSGARMNVEHLLGHKRFELVRNDVTFPFYVEVDQIYNLACPASPIHYQRDPVQTTKTSVHGAINMLGLAKRVKATILQASTSEVYGDPSVHPQTEDYWGHVNPVGPRSCYDEGKRCAETLFFDYAATPEEIAARRKAFIRKWRLKHRAVADSLEEAGDRLFTFTRLPPSHWRSARTTNAIERLHEEFKRRVKTQTVLPSARGCA